nr:hypothetical protein [uncultured Pseudomonas sp.]
MQKPNQGSEKKRESPEMGGLGAKLWRSASFIGNIRTKMGWTGGKGAAGRTNIVRFCEGCSGSDGWRKIVWRSWVNVGAGLPAIAMLNVLPLSQESQLPQF